MRTLEAKMAMTEDGNHAVHADLQSWHATQTARASSERIRLAIFLGGVVTMMVLVLLSTGI